MKMNETIVGRKYPNHFLDIDNLNGEKSFDTIKHSIDKKRGRYQHK